MSHKANFWLAQLDPRLVKSGAFRVLFHLCDHHNDDKDPLRACFPSQETLRARTGMANATLNSALSQMEEAGLIRRKRSTIPGTPTRRTYYILGCDFAEVDEQTPKTGVSSNSGVPELAPEIGGEQTPVSEGANSGFQGGKLRSTGEDPKRNKKEKNMCPAKNAAHTHKSFEDFWEAYPRSRNRAEAEKAFERALASGVSSTWIIYAAKAYRVEQAANQKSYMCSPENWLDQRRWENFPLQSDASTHVSKISDDVLMFWANRINAGKYITPSAVSVPIAQGMLSRKLVTLAQLMKAGVTV